MKRVMAERRTMQARRTGAHIGWGREANRPWDINKHITDEQVDNMALAIKERRELDHAEHAELQLAT